ncbi:unnamed protein product [Allacma fusca]|uniref:G-protein coupled receptors family 1 profile domain-containing protein n=1 Tax=Allacma fusca TaxID=39272 RepID=A0A8J2PIJ6_9HEXA|nr:unnamed protein product [Allacma fusca]
MTSNNDAENITSYGNIRQVVTWVHSIMGVIAMCFNFIIFFSFYWFERPVEPTLYFPMSLALADGIYMASFLFEFGWRIPKCAGLITVIFNHSWMLIPMLHIIAIEFALFCGVSFPRKYSYFMTGRKIGAIIFIAWFGPITLIVGYFGFGTAAGQEIISWDCNKYFFVEDNNWRIILTAIFSISILVIVLMDIHTLYVLKKIQQTVQENTEVRRCRRYVMRTFHGLLISCLVGWGPYCVLYFVLCADCFHVSNAAIMIVYWVTKSLVILRALFSPFLYALRFRNIREALIKLLNNYRLLRNTRQDSKENSAEAVEMGYLHSHP